jgi:hypothetical protein
VLERLGYNKTAAAWRADATASPALRLAMTRLRVVLRTRVIATLKRDLNRQIASSRPS